MYRNMHKSSEMDKALIPLSHNKNKNMNKNNNGLTTDKPHIPIESMGNE